MADKVIVTNLTVLKEKYGAAGLATIKKAVSDLVAADKERGFKTVLIGVDDATALGKLKTTPVTKPTSPEQNKIAIDGIYKALTPDYLMILGAIDVIPHQDLKNSMFSTEPDADDEKFAYSDLPYACDAPYSKDVNTFTGPTRVVGRLPDITGHKGSPRYLLGLLGTATKWKSRQREEYENYLGISVEKWKKSTALSLRNTFNSDKDLQTCPANTPKWKLSLFNRRAHFINCHGGDTLPDFYGQAKNSEEVGDMSHRASFVEKTGNVLEGTVVAAECCFGGQLYDPTAEENGQLGMCNSYLGRKAYAFFGSTTTAYGPFSGNNQADLICQYFLQRVLAGASAGRAALEARQRFVETKAPLSNMNQKTLAQFNLCGDPSIVPVDIPSSKLAVGPKAFPLAKTFASKAVTLAKSKAARDVASIERGERREKLRARGVMCGEMQPSFKRREKGPSKKVRSSMQALMRHLKLRSIDTLSYDVRAKRSTGWKSLKGLSKGVAKTMAETQPQTTAFHVGFGVSAARATGSKKKAMKRGVAGTKKDANVPSPMKSFVVVEAKEVDGIIVSYTEAHSK